MRPLLPLSYLSLLLLCIAHGYGQIPQRVTVDLRMFDGAEPISGSRHLTIRWYDVPINGTWIEQEEFDADITAGRVQVQLGSTSPIPHDLLRSGDAWLGVSVDGGAELAPRTMLVSVSYAQYTEHAMVADRLSGDVTGVVTSMNEIAGAVKVLGEGGIVVRSDGDALIVGIDQPLESGVVQGNDRQHVFIIKPLTRISSSCRVTAVVVSSTTTITCGIASVDVVANTISIITSAALTRDESIHWLLLRR